MKRVVVLGGGPAGAFAAERLAAAGLRTAVLDEKLAWEKPCGGGITYKAYRRYPFLIDNDAPKKVVTESWLGAPRAGRVRMDLTHPMLIYARYDLNHLMLRRAERAGAQIEKTRVNGIERRGRGWTIRTRHGNLDADYCIVATGARNPFRDVGTAWTSHDTMYALGYYVASNRQHIDIEFPRGLEGYIWVFPREGHLSVGICGKGEPALKLRARLEQYMRENEIPVRDAQFYAHVLPALHTPSWRTNRVSGEGWLAVGDAGGLVDPVTGEGLYYAIRSADLASQIVVADAQNDAGKAEAYRGVLERDFGYDLYLGSLIANRVFLGNFLYSSVPARIVEFIRRSPRFRALMQDLFAGVQGYEGLNNRLLRTLNGTLHELFASFLVRRMIPNLSQL
jgi:geranylgeranyl reductase family protein